MAGRSRRPRVIKGALVVAPSGRPPTAITFQYNPHTLTRQLSARRLETDGRPGRLTGAPEESISLEVEIDAADQLGQGDEVAQQMGIHPQLAALETLLYPPVTQVLENAALMHAGTIEVVPPAAPLVLFVWGKQRVLPVELTDFSVTEEAYDPDLNPIRARVSLGLRVLTYSDLTQSHPGYHVFMAHQIVKEAMAIVDQTDGLVRNLSDLVEGGV